MHISFTRKLLLNFEDIVDLRAKKMIGQELKPGLLNDTILLFHTDKGFFGVAVRPSGEWLEAKLLHAVTEIENETLETMIRNACYTTHGNMNAVVDFEPYYTLEETGRG